MEINFTLTLISGGFFMLYNKIDNLVAGTVTISHYYPHGSVQITISQIHTVQIRLGSPVGPVPIVNRTIKQQLTLCITYVLLYL